MLQDAHIKPEKAGDLQRRRENNRLAAHRCRARKQAALTTLKETNAAMAKQILQLERELEVEKQSLCATKQHAEFVTAELNALKAYVTLVWNAEGSKEKAHELAEPQWNVHSIQRGLFDDCDFCLSEYINVDMAAY